jgi:hypothetical protein
LKGRGFSTWIWSFKRRATAITAKVGESSEVVVHDISGDDTAHDRGDRKTATIPGRGGSASRVVLKRFSASATVAYGELAT